MCKCSGKCGCNITQITKGEKGDTGDIGPTGPQGISGIFFQDSSEIGFPGFEITVAGDYIIILNLHVLNNTPDDISDFDTDFTVDGTPEANENSYRRHYPIATGGSITYTHQLKCTGRVVGEVVGFATNLTNATLVSGSMTLIRIA